MAVPEPLEPLDRRITSWMARYGTTLTRLALGIVFTWFGALKFFPGTSPAETLATDTITRITAGHVPRDVALIGLAVWEVLIGIGLLSGKLLRVTLLLLFRRETFVNFPLVPTLEGQYIIKNLVLISAAIVVGASVRKKDAKARTDAEARRREVAK